MDHQPRSGVRPRKGARDRLIRLAATHPEWALGFQDEVWWSRLAAPCLHAWSDPDRSLRLVEQPRPKDDLDPKALACHGLRIRSAAPRGGGDDHGWLRVVGGRPISAITTQILAWCCDRLRREARPLNCWSGKC